MKRRRIKSTSRLAAYVVFLAALVAPYSLQADYHLERITPILNQPTFVTQAPGDPTNILFYATRIATPFSGANVTNTMGKIWRYDVLTRTSTAVLDFNGRQLTLDLGIQGFAFHPDFNDSNSAGYGKIYVSTARLVQGAATCFVEEFQLLNADGTFKSPGEPFASARVILSYPNGANNHAIGWIGFDPTATNAARDYLYISTGQGPIGAGPSQNPNFLQGKILRVDISGADDYLADPNKNFAIPASNPIPAYNADTNHAPIPGLGEVYVTGLRNGYRGSFDRATGDIYWGDVGENLYEEVDFLKAGDTLPGPPRDFGWPQWEGVHASPFSPFPKTTNQYFTNIVVTSRKPLQEWTVSAGECAIGGYVYRGPIPELQGKYIYADFVSGKIWMLDFDRNTDPATFNGSTGTRTDLTALWNAMVVDATNKNYRGDLSVGTINGLDHIVSFGEDNEGNLYVVDLGNGSTFDGQYTANGGEIYKLVPGPSPAPDMTTTLTNGNILFNWPGFSFKLQAQTNGLAPNGWADYPQGGTGPVTVPIDKSQTSVFFRLKWKF